MVGTKRSSQPEFRDVKKKRSGSTESGCVFEEPLGGLFTSFGTIELMDGSRELHFFGQGG
ncbi:hypothetical protein R1flu_000971 [Riccia fluitans]|uniref:Uncharacterized protein n=1 Tax=Riccia fluitans TaxID=41844 RepID=A0ABD1Y1Z3_9MARC